MAVSWFYEERKVKKINKLREVTTTISEKYLSKFYFYFSILCRLIDLLR